MNLAYTTGLRAQLAELQEYGVTLLRGVFPLDPLAGITTAAERCFAAIEAGAWPSFPAHYRFSPYSCSLLASALLDFGCPREDLTAPLSVPGLADLFTEAMGAELTCEMPQSWVRKRYAPSNAPAPYHPNSWHQDGGLGVRFPPLPGPSPPAMTALLTCWLPLNPCGKDRPGLELVRRRLNTLLHYTELDDFALRRRFAPEDFWMPPLEVGDGLIFLDGTLHRTSVRPQWQQDRLSVEFRFFPLAEEAA